jgi:hypothetical protein
MVRIITGFIILCYVLSAQNVTVTPSDWSAHGIEITPYSSPSFAGKASAVAPAPIDFTPLHPFSFFMTNHTGHTIVAYSALWIVEHPTGTVTRQGGFAGSLRSRGSGLAIPNGTDWLVTSVPASAGSPNLNVLSHIQDDILQHRNAFPVSGRVTVSLEAVVLDDGLVLGPDSSRTIPRMRAQADVLKELASEVLNGFNNGGDQAVIDLLSGMKAGPYISLSAAATMPSEDEAYAAFLAHERYVLTNLWLKMAQGRAPLVLERLARHLANETYLAVHR